VVGAGPKPKGTQKGCLPRGLELERELLQMLTLEKHALLKAPPNRLLKTFINVF
jgi:hypothetical protein